MADIINRDELEARLSRALGKSMRGELERLLEIVGDPPDLSKLSESFWLEAGKEMSAAIIPILTDVFLSQAQSFIETQGIGVDWALVNTAAVDWARSYAFDLVTGITNTSRNFLQKAIANYFEQGWTMQDLTESISRIYSPFRAEMIAITEVTRASVQGELATIQELLRQYPNIKFKSLWNTNNDDLVCPICEPLNQKPKEVWQSTAPDGPPAHVRCLPGSANVLPIGRVAAGSERWYKGNVIRIETLENKLAVTPNHPILTPSGWVAAGLLQKGDKVIGYSPGKWESALIEVNNQNRITTIENVFSTLNVDGFRMPTAAPDFHGDGAESDVAVIRPNREIVNDRKAHIYQPTAKNDFVIGDVVIDIPLPIFSSQAQFIEGYNAPASGSVSGFNLARALLGGHVFPLDSFSLGLSPGRDARFYQAEPESGAIDPCFLSEPVLALAGHVTAQKIIKIRNEYFTGHVYNLQTESGLYVADGIITHNCRCWLNHEVILANN